jgi:hypothetical protein
MLAQAQTNELEKKELERRKLKEIEFKNNYTMFSIIGGVLAVGGSLSLYILKK